MVFPRMKHIIPLRDRVETKLPYEVEAFWLEHLVYPALSNIESRGAKPYIDITPDDVLYRNRQTRDKSLLIASDHLDQLLVGIQKILDEKKEDEFYSRFRSFFFVLQAVGIKLSTSMDQDWADLWTKLAQQHPSLDWKHMEDPDNGELLVDVGIGIHPPENSQVVGFWDVEALRVGYDYGGYARGTTHGVSTVWAIGGIHAEMGGVRKKHTHIAYRLSYNLAYEIHRGLWTRQKEKFFPVSATYKQDPQYRDAIRSMLEAFDRNINKSFGVRDEYRCRGSSIKRVFPHLKARVRAGIAQINSSCLWFHSDHRIVL